MELLARTVHRVATPDDLKVAGDYCTTDHLETSGAVCYSIIINCPFCSTANAVVLPKPSVWDRFVSLFKWKKELNLNTTFACYGNPEKHRFVIRNNEIIPATV